MKKYLIIISPLLLKAATSAQRVANYQHVVHKAWFQLKQQDNQNNNKDGELKWTSAMLSRYLSTAECSLYTICYLIPTTWTLACSSASSIKCFTSFGIGTHLLSLHLGMYFSEIIDTDLGFFFFFFGFSRSELSGPSHNTCAACVGALSHQVSIGRQVPTRILSA